MIYLKLLSTCLPDYFQGSGKPVIHIPVDANTTANQLKNDLVNSEDWPVDIDDLDILDAVTACIGKEALEKNTRLFPEIYPDDLPEGYAISYFDTTGHYLIIDKSNYEVVDYSESVGGAHLFAWQASDQETPQVYAYFEVEVSLEDDWEVLEKNYVASAVGGLQYAVQYIPMYTPNGFTLPPSNTEAEARIAIINHCRRMPTGFQDVRNGFAPEPSACIANADHKVIIRGPQADRLAKVICEYLNE